MPEEFLTDDWLVFTFRRLIERQQRASEVMKVLMGCPMLDRRGSPHLSLSILLSV
jgi:hypothetical protein